MKIGTAIGLLGLVCLQGSSALADGLLGLDIRQFEQSDRGQPIPQPSAKPVHYQSGKNGVLNIKGYRIDYTYFLDAMLRLQSLKWDTVDDNTMKISGVIRGSEIQFKGYAREPITDIWEGLEGIATFDRADFEVLVRFKETEDGGLDVSLEPVRFAVSDLKFKELDIGGLSALEWIPGFSDLEAKFRIELAHVIEGWINSDSIDFLHSSTGKIVLGWVQDFANKKIKEVLGLEPAGGPVGGSKNNSQQRGITIHYK
jgi:hypothetical protein